MLHKKTDVSYFALCMVFALISTVFCLLRLQVYMVYHTVLATFLYFVDQLPKMLEKNIFYATTFILYQIFSIKKPLASNICIW